MGRQRFGSSVLITQYFEVNDIHFGEMYFKASVFSIINSVLIHLEKRKIRYSSGNIALKAKGLGWEEEVGYRPHCYMKFYHRAMVSTVQLEQCSPCL